MSQAVVSSPASTLWGGGRSPFNVRWGKMYMWIFLVSDAFTFSSLLISYGTLRHRYADTWPKPADVFHHFPFIHGSVPLAYVGLMTFILIMSSVTMVLAVDAGHSLNRKAVILWLGLTIVGGLMFLGSQAWEWYHFITGNEEAKVQMAYELADGSILKRDHTNEANFLLNNDYSNVLTEAQAESMIKAPGTQPIVGATLTHNEYGRPAFADFFFFITGFHGFHVFSGVMINLIVLILVIQGFNDKKKNYELVEKVGLYWHFVDLVWVFVFTFFYLL